MIVVVMGAAVAMVVAVVLCVEAGLSSGATQNFCESDLPGRLGDSFDERAGLEPTWNHQQLKTSKERLLQNK